MPRTLLAAALVAACSASSEEPAPAPPSLVDLPEVSAAPPSTASALSRRAVGPAKPAGSPEEAWQLLLAAMRADEAVGAYATVKGLDSLESQVSGEPRATAFARWGKGWQAWEIRWVSKSDRDARANLGPEVKEHGLWFVSTSEGWKLDRWQPGQ